MLQPKKTKFRKAFKGKIHGNAKGGTDLNFGSYGLKAMEPERITARQIEAARRAITRHIKRQGRLWIRVFPDVPVSKKPAEVRQGKGKGSVEYWAARVKPGRILFTYDVMWRASNVKWASRWDIYLTMDNAVPDKVSRLQQYKDLCA